MITDIKQDLKQAYDAFAHEREKSHMQEWKRRARRAFLGALEKEGKCSLLEIGAGHGGDSVFFGEHGLAVTAVDFSEQMVRLCREKGIDAYEMDFCELSRLGRRFDAIWAMNCLLHVERASLGLVLQEIDAVLNPGGLVFMGVYGGQEWEGTWEEDTYVPKRFFVFYTDDGIQAAVREHFDIVSFDRIHTGGKYHFQSIVMRKG